MKIFFVDFKKQKIYFGDADELLQRNCNDRLNFPLLVDDKVFFHIEEFRYDINISEADMEKFKALCTKDEPDAAPTFTDEQAVERVIDLHRKKLDGMQADFEQVIRGLLKYSAFSPISVLRER